MERKERVLIKTFQAKIVSMRAAALVFVAIAMGAGCARKTARVPLPPPLQNVKRGYTEEGIASWYGHPYHGRRTANGEIYDMNNMTAAHKTLPFGVWVEVENKRNKRTVGVRINDRGPFIDGRIIDVSREAAQRLEMIGPGIVPVKIKVVRIP
jgi:rare lipoprotein A